jgi:membrane protein implicated in regulation of membrane protease activity
MFWWLWVLLGFFLLLTELLTPGGLYLLFFGASAIVVGLLGGMELSGPDWMQWLLFSILSIVALALFRRPLLRKLRLATQSKEVDSLVGETAAVLEDIPVEGVGKAELRGTSWSARNVGTSALVRGQLCTVEKVDGLHLWVRE